MLCVISFMGEIESISLLPELLLYRSPHTEMKAIKLYPTEYSVHGSHHCFSALKTQSHDAELLFMVST